MKPRRFPRSPDSAQQDQCGLDLLNRCGCAALLRDVPAICRTRDATYSVVTVSVQLRPLQEQGKWSWSPVSDTRCRLRCFIPPSSGFISSVQFTDFSPTSVQNGPFSGWILVG